MVFGVAVAVIEAAWTASRLTAGSLLLVLLGVYWWWYRDAVRPLDALVRGQRRMILAYGPVIVGGCVAGGVLALLSGSRLLGAAVVAAVTGHALVTREMPEAADAQLSGWRDYRLLAWLPVPLVAVGAVLGQPLLQSVAALVFYGALFWNL